MESNRRVAEGCNVIWRFYFTCTLVRKLHRGRRKMVWPEEVGQRVDEHRQCTLALLSIEELGSFCVSICTFVLVRQVN